MKNKKGFTLIEVLATVVIIGIISTIAIVAVTKYLQQSRDEAYNMLGQTVYEAVSNCAAESNCILSNGTEYKSEELKSLGYIDSLKNPRKESEECSGRVIIRKEDATGNGNTTISKGDELGDKIEVDESYSDYIYKVTITCDNKDRVTYWPKGTEPF